MMLSHDRRFGRGVVVGRGSRRDGRQCCCCWSLLLIVAVVVASRDVVGV